MAELFDKYDASYGAAVQSSIEFSGLPHSFFLQAKADLLRGLVDEHVGGPHRPQMLDVGCGVGSLHPYLRVNPGTAPLRCSQTRFTRPDVTPM